MNPHFLFNSLNAIVELIHEDPKSAERVVTRLGELLRTCLSGSNAQEIPLRQEVEFVRQYADIEKTRFDDRLTITFSIAEPTLDTLVPNFVLQPLVENAIKHGLRGRDTRGTVVIESAYHDGRLRLRVADNGGGMPPGETARNGTGLANTRNRLERLYGNAYEFIARNRAGGGFESIVLIPCRKAS